MAYSNWDYLRRFNLQRHYFQRCRQNVKKPNRMYRNPTFAVAGLLPSPRQKGVRGRNNDGVPEGTGAVE